MKQNIVQYLHFNGSTVSALIVGDAKLLREADGKSTEYLLTSKDCDALTAKMPLGRLVNDLET